MSLHRDSETCTRSSIPEVEPITHRWPSSFLKKLSETAAREGTSLSDLIRFQTRQSGLCYSSFHTCRSMSFIVISANAIAKSSFAPVRGAERPAPIVSRRN